MNYQGVTVREINVPVKELIDRLQSLLTQRGATIYARINQQAEVNHTGQHLFPLEFILFGNPKGGGPLMAVRPEVALDLPLKVIAWNAGNGKTRVAYNDGKYVEGRYSLPHDANSPLHLDHLIDDLLSS